MTPRRTELGAYLNRNLYIEPEYKAIDGQDNEAGITEASLLDPSNLYYGFNFTLYYSLESYFDKKADFLKQTELFLTSGFQSNFAEGSCALLADYINATTGQISAGHYIRCGLEDIVAGFTSPVYKKENFFLFLRASFLRLPISRKSQLVSLRYSSSGALTSLYFLKKDKKGSLGISSSHRLGYSYFKYFTADKNKTSFNRPLSMSNGLSFILKQNWSFYLPVSVRLSGSHQLAFNNYKVTDEDCKSNNLAFVFCGSREHYISLGLSSSWRLPKRVFLSLSASWKDLISVSNPLDKDVFSSQVYSFAWYKWYITTALSYSF